MNNFDKIYVIHLDHDISKKEKFLRWNQHVPFDFLFFPGVHGENDENCQSIFKDYLRKPVGYPGCSRLEQKYQRKMLKSVGQIGYLQSMMRIFMDAKQNNYKKIIIFDDDVILHKNFNTLFSDIMKKINTFHILRLGCSNHAINRSLHLLRQPFFNSIDCDGSFATCFSSETFDYFLSKIPEYNCSFDSGCLRDFKREFPNAIDLTCYEFLAIADVTKSSILEDRHLPTLAKKLYWNLDNFKMD